MQCACLILSSVSCSALNLVSRKSKLKLYRSVIRAIAVYGCETWVLRESIIQNLSVFERKILREIFEPTKEDNGIWRIKTNKELDELTLILPRSRTGTV